MNKIRLSQLFYFGLVLMLAACQSVSQSGEAFQPGETIDGMRLTTGARDAVPLWVFCSPVQDSVNGSTFECTVPVMPRLAIGHFLTPADDTLSQLNWSDSAWELTMDSQPIDLKSFGTYDFVMPAVPHKASPVREVFLQFTAWDVVLTDLLPGQHTLHGSVQTDTGSYTWIIRLTIEATRPDN